MRVAITGAAGFIGSHLADRLNDLGDDVLGVDNFDPYYDPAIKHANVAGLKQKSIAFETLDILDRQELLRALGEWRPDVIVHLAAKAGVRASIKQPHDYAMTNYIGTQNVLDAALAADCGQVVFASTSSVYGDSETIPFVETYDATRPLQPYAASKRGAEMMAGTYHHLYGLNTTVTRFFTVYGPRGRPDMMPYKLCDSIINGVEIPLFEGDLSRDWTYVTDICDGLSAAARTPLGFEIVNLGRGEPQSLALFIETTERLAGRKANLLKTPRPASEMMRTFASIDRAKALLDFNPTISIEEGISHTLDWFSESTA